MQRGDYIAKYDKEVEAGNMQTMTTEYPGTMVLCYEQSEGGKSGLMKNVNIRKAISYSINREEMVSAVYGRYTAPTASFPGDHARRNFLPQAGVGDHERGI